MRILAYLLLGCVALGGSAGTGSCGPVLNEVMADPASDWDGSGAYSSRDDEWVEIYNPGTASLTLDGYLIGDENLSPLFGFSGTLAAGAHKVVYGGDAVAYQQSHALNVYGLRLGNDGDTVTLLQVVGTDTLLVDSYTYNTYEAEDDRSSGRRPDGSAVWQLFDALNPYTGIVQPVGTGLLPTPGQSNGAVPVPAVAIDLGDDTGGLSIGFDEMRRRDDPGMKGIATEAGRGILRPTSRFVPFGGQAVSACPRKTARLLKPSQRTCAAFPIVIAARATKSPLTWIRWIPIPRRIAFTAR